MENRRWVRVVEKNPNKENDPHEKPGSSGKVNFGFFSSFDLSPGNDPIEKKYTPTDKNNVLRVNHVYNVSLHREGKK